jgi:hypothetical protein
MGSLRRNRIQTLAGKGKPKKAHNTTADRKGLDEFAASLVTATVFNKY